MAYDKALTENERERISEEVDDIKSIGFGFEIRQLGGIWKGRGRQDVAYTAVIARRNICIYYAKFWNHIGESLSVMSSTRLSIVKEPLRK